MDIPILVQQYQGVVIALFTVVIALATVAYALLTWLLVKETRKLRQAQNEPLIGVYLGLSEPWSFLFDLVMRNHGPGPAHDVRWEVDADVDDLKAHGAAIQEILGFAGLSYLAPGQEIRFHFGTAPSLLGGEQGPSAKPFKVTTFYKTVTRELRSALFVLDIGSFRGMALGRKPPEERIVESLESLHRVLQAKGH